jgi:uncharacterized protein YkwD
LKLDLLNFKTKIKEKSAKVKRIYLVSGVGILVIALSVGGFFYWKNRQEKRVVSVKKETVSQKNENSSVNPDNKDQSTVDEKPSETPKVADNSAATSATPVTPTQNTQPSSGTVTPTPVKKSTPTSTPTSAPAPAPTPIPAPAPAFDPEDYVESRLLALINAERARVGVGALASNGLLNQAADIRVPRYRHPHQRESC